MDFLLETFVFAYIGLQLSFVLEELAESEDPGLTRTLIAAGVLLLAAIVFRLVAVVGLFGRWSLRTGRRGATPVTARRPGPPGAAATPAAAAVSRCRRRP